MRVSAILALLVGTSFCVEAKDKKFSLENMELKIDGKGGKFKIYRKDAGENETNKIEIRWEDLQEVDANGTEVLKDGKHEQRHSIKDFKKQDFTFTEPRTVTLVDLPANFSLKSATATKLDFKSTVNSIGMFKVDTYIVNNKGVAGPDEESLWTVAPGDIKFNIELSDWKFCGYNNMTCRSKPDKPAQTGEFVDIKVLIKGKNKGAVMNAGETEGRKGKGKKSDYQLGGGINLFLTNLISIDGNLTEMPEGYPMTELKKDGTVFTFRFPRFNSTAVYDPVIGTGQAVTGQVTSGALGLGCTSYLATAFVALLARIL